MPAGSSQTISAAGLGRHTDCNGYQRRHHDHIRDDSWEGTPKPRRSHRGFFMAMRQVKIG